MQTSEDIDLNEFKQVRKQISKDKGRSKSRDKDFVDFANPLADDDDDDEIVEEQGGGCCGGSKKKKEKPKKQKKNTKTEASTKLPGKGSAGTTSRDRSGDASAIKSQMSITGGSQDAFEMDLE